MAYLKCEISVSLLHQLYCIVLEFMHVAVLYAVSLKN